MAKPKSKSKSKSKPKEAVEAMAPSLDGLVRSVAPSIRFTNLDKLLYADEGITKGALAAYYAVVADRILPHLEGRPVTLLRCPDGVGHGSFFQKHVKVGVPDAIHRIDVAEAGGAPETYMVIDDVEGLLGAVQLGSLELHIWGSRRGALETPDQLVFDLDPDPTVAWPDVARAAVELRDLLETLGLKSWVKTTGGKGLHVVVPVAPRTGWPEARELSNAIADLMVHAAPDRFTTNMAKAARPRKIFIDFLRNGRGATAVAPYSTRARPGALVATPITWKELEDGARPDAFDLPRVPDRVRAKGKDPWDGFFAVEQSLERAARKLARGG